MDDDPHDACGPHRFQKPRQGRLGYLVIDADAAFDGDLGVARIGHRGDAIADALRLAHQHRAEASRLHAVGRAADIEVDLGISVLCANPRGLRQFRRIGPAQLQRHGLLRRIEGQEVPRAAANQGGRRDHLGVKQNARTEQPVKVPAMAIGPVHHGCHGQPVGRMQVHAFVLYPVRRGRHGAANIRLGSRIAHGHESRHRRLARRRQRDLPHA
jgi:hypothetical protein